MSNAQELPARMCCLVCFSPEALERRTDKKGRPYFSCQLCHLRLFIHNDTQAFGVIFWARTLADGALVQAARADLERALGRRGRPAAAAQPRSATDSRPLEVAVQPPVDTAAGAAPEYPSQIAPGVPTPDLGLPADVTSRTPATLPGGVQ